MRHRHVGGLCGHESTRVTALDQSCPFVRSSAARGSLGGARPTDRLSHASGNGPRFSGTSRVGVGHA